jgi:mannan endo-1,4-beta-mannosidase
MGLLSYLNELGMFVPGWGGSVKPTKLTPPFSFQNLIRLLTTKSLCNITASNKQIVGLNVLNGKLGRLLRKGALSLSFAAVTVGGAGLANAAAPASPEDIPKTPPAITMTTPAPEAEPLAFPDLFAAPADPNASAATGTLFNYLSALPRKPSHRLVSGQWTGYGTVDTGEIKSIEQLTGQRVGLVGADYLDISGTRMNFGGVNPNMINYWNDGSLVDIDAHFPNPWTGRGPIDMTIVNFSDVITPGMPAYKAYMAHLDVVAAGLQQLQEAGVTVLFRPMMEMDGDWFWWGQQPDFPKLWIQTFDYLTNTKGLHNLLWVYSADGRAPLAYYPSAQYVDIVGCDAYGYGLDGGKTRGYDTLRSTGKPFALTEFGLQSAAYTFETNPPYDLFAAVRNIEANMPATVYFMAWSNARGDGLSYWGIDAQLNAPAALNAPSVQNGAVPWKAPGTGDRPPPPPKTN